jgi:hypothetical protein
MAPIYPEIAEALTGLHRGGPSALLAELDPRTRWSRAFTFLRAAAEEAGCAVVSVPSAESDQVSDQSRLLATLAAAVAVIGDGGTIASQTAELLDAMAQDAPVVVIIEDASWSDPGTLLALRTLPELLGHLPILWAVGVLPGPSRADRVVSSLHRFGAVTIPAEPPEHEVIASTPVELLQVGAVIGIEFDPDIAAQVLGRPVGSLLGEIERALGAGVLAAGDSTLRFVDARFRDRLYEALPSPVRRALHYEVARRQMAWPGGETEAVWHLSRSTSRLTEDDLRVLCDAIRRLAAVAPEDAAELAFQVSELFRPTLIEASPSAPPM